MSSRFLSVHCWLAVVLLLGVIAGAESEQHDDRQLQSSNPRVVAEAYECDEYLRELPQAERDAYKPLGYEVRVCIRPTRPTRNRGIVMRSIDDFTWYKALGTIVQPAVVKKADVSRTLQLCIPGRVVCTLKTKLFDDFFYNPTNATVVGTGTVSMQVQGDDSNPTIRRQLGADENGIFQTVVEWTIGHRGLQVGSALGGYAGSSGVSLELNVDRREPPDDFVPFVEEDVTSWWEDSPTWLKVLVIAGAIILFLMGCCLCVMFCWAFREYVQDEKDKSKNLDDDVEEQFPKAGVTVNPPVNAWDDYDQTETADENRAPDGTQPTDKDICFDADKHPGTKAMHAAVDKTLKKYPTAEYSPEQYRHIKKQLPGRRFFVCDDSDYPNLWREVAKSELVQLLQNEFDQKQRQQQFTTAMTRK